MGQDITLLATFDQTILKLEYVPEHKDVVIETCGSAIRLPIDKIALLQDYLKKLQYYLKQQDAFNQ